jgi:LmbE family N-acetylglucosaminyl deacetylase
MSTTYNNKKDLHITVLAAHLDDIEFGCFIYLKRELEKAKENKQVVNLDIHISSQGLKNKTQEFNIERLKTFFKNMNLLSGVAVGSISIVVEKDNLDTLFPENFPEIRERIETFIKERYWEGPRNILIYHSKDIHRDHNVINQIGNVLARPNSQYKFHKVLNFNIPQNNYSDYGISNNSQNSGSIFKILTKKEKRLKKEILNKYYDIGVLHNKIKNKDIYNEKLTLLYQID